MRIVIIGYPGSGKESLADYIENRYYCAKLCLDQIVFEGETKERSLALTEELLNRFINDNISWVIEGDDFDVLFEKRMEIADKIVIMKYRRLSCLIKYLRRMSKEGKKADSAYINWILFGSRNREHRDRYKDVMRRYSDKTVMIFNDMQLLMLRDLI